MRERQSAYLNATLARAAAALFLPLGIIAAVPPCQAAVADDAAPALNNVSGVYVRDSGLANDKLELAKRMEGMKEWHKSADVYQELLEKYRDRVVAVAFDQKQQPTKYASVAVVAQERMSRWPAEGLAAYRARFELPAAALLEQTQRDDLAGLHRIVDQYPITIAAAQAGVRLMDLYRERGDFAGAIRIGQQLLNSHPSLDSDKPGVMFRTGLACALAGDNTQARQWLEQLRAAYPDQRGAVGGLEKNLADALAELVDRGPLASHFGDGGESWPTFSGDITRSRIGGRAGKPAARLYGVSVRPFSLDGVSEPQKQQVNAVVQAGRLAGMDLGIMPVVDRGQVFFHDGQQLSAMRLADGKPLDGWLASYPRSAGQFALTPTAVGNTILNMGEPWITMQLAIPRQHTLTVTDDSVLAVMGQSDLRPLGGAAPDRVGSMTASRLVCLQRDDGQKRWVADPSSLSRNNANPRNLVFSGCPLVVEGNVYITLRANDAGLEDCSIACYDLASGQLKWLCAVASCPSAGVNVEGMPMPLGGTSVSHLAYASGRLFVVTNLGVVGAVDAFGGAPAWLSVYGRADAPGRTMAAFNPDGRPNLSFGLTQLPKPWEFNAVIISNGKVFALPLDGTQLLIFDAATGQVVQRIDRNLTFNAARGRPARINLSMLLAVSGNKLIVADNGTLLCLDWTRYDQQRAGPGRLDEDEKSTLGLEVCPGRIMGRPFVGRDGLIVPLQGRLWIIDPVKFMPVGRYPQDSGQWPDDEGPGNVVAADGQVIVAASRGLSVYTSLEDAVGRYRQAIASNPSSVQARLDYSSVLFHAGKRDDALLEVDHAIELSGGAKSLLSNPAADQLYDHCLKLALRISSSTDAADIAWTNKFFDRAALSARAIPQQVGYRLVRGRFAEQLVKPSNADVAQALSLYQEILANSSMRLLVVAGDRARPWRPAGELAEQAITALVDKHGAELYKPYRLQASARLQQLGANANPADLLEVAAAYPNAPELVDAALRQAADAYAKANQPGLAAAVWRRVYTGTSPQRADERFKLQEQLVRMYLKAGDYQTALLWVTRLAQTDGATAISIPLMTAANQPLLGQGGQPPRTYSLAVAAIQALARTEPAMALPDVRLPPPLTSAQKAAGMPWPGNFRIPSQPLVEMVDGLLRPGREIVLPQPTDRLLVASGMQAKCFLPGQPKPLWTSALSDEPTDACWLGQKVLIWSDGELAMLDGADGRSVWHITATAWPTIDAITLPAMPGQPLAGEDTADDPRRLGGEADDAPPPFPRQFRGRPLPRGLIGRTINGLVNSVTPDDGRQRIVGIVPQPGRTILATSTGRVAALDNGAGAPLWQLRIPTGSTITRLIANSEYAVLHLADRSGTELVAIDVSSGSLVWRKRFPAADTAAPLNIALSADGTLVWTSRIAMSARNLSLGEDRWTEAAANQGMYLSTTQPDQLLIANQQVLSICLMGRQRQVIRRGLADGKPIGKPIDLGVAESAASMCLLGPRLYALGGHALVWQHLDEDLSWTSRMDPAVVWQGDAMMITRDFAIVPGRASDGSGRYLLDAYSRLAVRSASGNPPMESGLRVHQVPVRPAVHITSWHALDGGVYYLGIDKALYWLAGTAEK